MADVSPKNLKSRFSVSIDIRPYLRDHYFEGKVVYPAVEAMVTLGTAVRTRCPDARLNLIAEAKFSRMLILEAGADGCEAQVEIDASREGIRASLLTSVQTKTGAMTRVLEHASVTFEQTGELPEPSLTCRAARKLEWTCINVPARSVYRELIPFGGSYRNITGDLSVAKDGVLADISGGMQEDALLGSPFALDAVMHAACVWGQRFTGTVPFPVGMDHRVIYRPTRKGASYLGRVTPVDVSREPFIFNAWIFDSDGIICESITGLRMRDVTQGRMKPPGWIKDEAWKT